MPPEKKRLQSVKWGLPDAAIGLGLAVAGVLTLLTLSAIPVPVAFPTSLSYLVVWIPLLGAVLIASYARGQKSLVRDFGLSFRWADLAWGIGAAILLRSCIPLLEFVAFGTWLRHDSTLTTGLVGPALIAVLVATVVVSPVIEELFFRGLLLRAVSQSPSLARVFRVPVPSAFMTFVAVVVSSVLFAGVHLIGETSLSLAFVAGSSAVLLAIVTALFTVKTHRLGAGIVTHVFFNLLIALPAMGWWAS
jgi:membrane protease YdiL (CAAX protease family)